MTRQSWTCPTLAAPSRSNRDLRGKVIGVEVQMHPRRALIEPLYEHAHLLLRR